MREAGIDYASRQIREIWENGFKFAHVYSMNKPQVAADIKKNLEFML
jgi:methylenetetrahydrofolate reductase (NADPH)